MVPELLQVLSPAPGQIVVDCTLGYGGHAEAFLGKILPGGCLVGLDQDGIELPKTTARLRAAGFGEDVFKPVRANFAGILRALPEAGLSSADILLADLGVSSMQLDDPSRGFSLKLPGPLDMRMNPARGQPASAILANLTREELSEALAENNEPFAAKLSQELAGRRFDTTTVLAQAVRSALRSATVESRELAVRRVFQTLRILANDELSVLEALLRQIPHCLKPGGRAAILTFHSGEDRRVKLAFAEGARLGFYSSIAAEPLRPSAQERHDNPRSSAAKLRWAVKSACT